MTVTVGLVASPGPAAELAARVVEQLPASLSGRVPAVTWQVQLALDRLVEGPADLSQLIAAARRRLLEEDWQLVVCVTDLPLQTARRPVVAHASATHSVAVLSLPALGPVAVASRALDTIVRLVAALLTGDHDHTARELGPRVKLDQGAVRVVAGVLSGNLRLLLGMLRANRPWRLAVRLSRALVAAVAVGVFALVTSDVWRLATTLGPLRLAAIAAGSIVAVVLTIIVGADLWERAPRTAAREQVILFNLVTVVTVVIGVLALYLELLALTAVGVLLLVPDAALADALGRPTSAGDRLAVAWLACSLATIGGALGAGLESDEAVREAAYRYQPDPSA
jgi:uncharacterized membrane protein